MCTTQGRNEDENPKEKRNSVPETRGTEEETPEYCSSLCLKDQKRDGDIVSEADDAQVDI